MDEGKLVKRSGIVLLIVSILLLLATVTCVYVIIAVNISVRNSDEDGIGKAIGIIIMAFVSVILAGVGIFTLIFGGLNLATSITLLKSGTDLNVLKNKTKRLTFSVIVLYINGVAFIIAGLISLQTVPAAIIAFVIGIVSFVLATLLNKTVKTARKLKNEEA